MIYNCHDERILKNCIAYLQTEGLGKEVKFGPIRKSRNQESYFHACLKIVADHMGEDPEDLKMRIKYSVLPLREIKASNGQTYLYPESTANQPKDMYSKLIDAVLMMAAMLEIQLPTPGYFGLTERT